MRRLLGAIRLSSSCGLLLAALLAKSAGAALPTEVPAIQSPSAPDRLLLDVSLIGDRLVAVGTHGHIVTSDDGGANWAHADVPVSVMLTAVAVSDADTIWAVGHDGIALRSDDRGDSWRVAIDGSKIATMQIDAAEAAIARLQAELDALPEGDPSEETLTYALEDAEFDRDDARDVLEGGFTSPLLGASFLDAERGFIYGAYGILLATTDGGENWSLISRRLNNPNNNHLYAMARTNAGDLFLAGEAGVLFRSRDDGMTWDALDAGYSGSLFGLVVAADDSVVVFGLRGRIFRSEDGGESWQGATSNGRSTLLNGLAAPDGRLILVGSGGAWLESRDNGASFRLVDAGTRDPLNAVIAGPDGALIVTGFEGVRTAPVE